MKAGKIKKTHGPQQSAIVVLPGWPFLCILTPRQRNAQHLTGGEQRTLNQTLRHYLQRTRRPGALRNAFVLLSTQTHKRTNAQTHTHTHTHLPPPRYGRVTGEDSASISSCLYLLLFLFLNASRKERRRRGGEKKRKAMFLSHKIARCLSMYTHTHTHTHTHTESLSASSV